MSTGEVTSQWFRRNFNHQRRNRNEEFISVASNSNTVLNNYRNKKQDNLNIS